MRYGNHMLRRSGLPGRTFVCIASTLVYLATSSCQGPSSGSGGKRNELAYVALQAGKAMEMSGDSEEALRQYRQAFDGGEANAAAYLGAMYEDGRGVGQNPAEALR